MESVFHKWSIALSLQGRERGFLPPELVDFLELHSALSEEIKCLLC